MTTNGVTLASQVDTLVSAGLTSVNISLDTLNAEKFATITRRDKKYLYKVLQSIYLSLSKGIKVKINCVIIRGINDDEISDFIDLTKEFNLDVRFIGKLRH